MPIYLYLCPICGKTQEAIRKHGDRVICMCGVAMDKQPASFGFDLKGEGWYKGGKH